MQSRAIIGILALSLSGVTVTLPVQAGVCQVAARVASESVGVPLPILLGIMAVESDGQAWTLNVDGADRSYHDAPSALSALIDYLPISKNVDVGCFQISSRYHSSAFKNPAQMMSPIPNAVYAALFLKYLKDTKGNWATAVACYHSCTPDLGIPYLDAVRRRIRRMME